MTAGDSKAALTIPPQPALEPSPQPRPAPTARALPPGLVAQVGQNWTPIVGQNWMPIDTIVERHFGDRGAVCDQRLYQRRVLGWINAVVAACQDRHRPGRDAGAMRRRVNAAGKPGHHHAACTPQVSRQLLRELGARPRVTARAPT